MGRYVYKLENFRKAETNTKILPVSVLLEPMDDAEWDLDTKNHSEHNIWDLNKPYDLGTWTLRGNYFCLACRVRV